jgi:tRNA-intron endonuclease
MPSKKYEPIKAFFNGEKVLTENTDLARELFNTYRYGSIYRKTKVQLSLFEALYLLEKERIIIFDGRNKEYDFDRFSKKAQSLEKRFWTKYCVFRDFREKGYVIKTALKFGADFRVYDRGVKPGEDHAKWVVFPVSENEHTTWYEFSAKNRVAHSTKKRLLIAVVDEENDITYYENRWVRP